jgi:hypothetical protein
MKFCSSFCRIDPGRAHSGHRIEAQPGRVAPMSSRFVVPLLSTIAAFAAASTLSHGGEAAVVDLKLVIAVDISPSMSPREQRIQRAGYVAAFRSPRVAAAVASGAFGRIAVTYVEWAEFPVAVIPFTVVDGAESSERLATRLAALPIRQELRTSISHALLFSAGLLRDAPFAAERNVIDISGDGPNNNGPPVEGARDAVLAEGIVINGLPIMLDRTGQGFFETRGLDLYYEDCVVGGPGAFAMPVTRIEALAATIERKLLTEIAGGAAHALPVQKTRAPQRRADCLVGERARTPTAR